jgi:hypothetical protein
VAVVAAGSMAAVMIVAVSLNPDTYFFYRFQDRTRWRYPTVFVLVTILLSAAETWIAWRALAEPEFRRLWARALPSSGFLVVLAWALLFTVIHAPGFHIVHVLWLWLLTLGLAGAAVLSGASALYQKLRAGTRS